MLKYLAIALATGASLWIIVKMVGEEKTSQVLFNVPSTAHTPSFGITWMSILGLCVGYGMYRVIKGK